MGLNVTAEDLASITPPVFDTDEIVEFICLDADENVQYQKLFLRCKILSGKHAGLPYTLSFSLKKEPPILWKKTVMFVTKFFTSDEITAGETPISRFIGRRFQAKAEAPREWQGKTYQDFYKFEDLGTADTPIASTAPDIDVPF